MVEALARPAPQPVHSAPVPAAAVNAMPSRISLPLVLLLFLLVVVGVAGALYYLGILKLEL